MKRIYVLKEYCVGCGWCKVVCATVHSKYPDSIIKAFLHSDERPVPRLILENNGHDTGAFSCRHCDPAPCMEACITGALYREGENGAVRVDDSRCVGCATCMLACPYGLIELSSSGKRVALKCDLCAGLADIPQCVLNCPNEALIYGEVG